MSRFDTLMDNAEFGKGFKKVAANITIGVIAVLGIALTMLLMFGVVQLLILTVATFGPAALAIPLGVTLVYLAWYGSNK